MGWDLVEGRYGMLMDVMSITTAQSPSGEIQRDWTLSTTNVPCYARPLRATGTRLAGTGERWGEEYADMGTIKVHCAIKLDRSSRITNIRDVNGVVIWQEPNGTPTIFNVTGSSPVVEPFNNFTEWDNILLRADPQ